MNTVLTFFRQNLRDWRLILLLLAIVLLAVTFFNPSLTLQRAVHRYIAVFDITQSMNVSDVGEPPQTRLDFAKQRLGETINGLTCGSEMGLALFTGHRVFLLFSPIEVCSHYGELTTMINNIDWRMAWEARSEVAKGLHKSIELVEDIGEDIRIVFISDGHEAPPVHANFRPAFRGEVGAVQGLIVGVGGNVPMPIPKLDSDGRLMGYWQAHEVMQVDRYSLGRGGDSDNIETMVGVENTDIAQRIQAGTEHLSTLREPYLQRLAQETGLNYHRLQSAQDLSTQLNASELALSEARITDMRWLLALIALILLIGSYVKRLSLKAII